MKYNNWGGWLQPFGETISEGGISKKKKAKKKAQRIARRKNRKK